MFSSSDTGTQPLSREQSLCWESEKSSMEPFSSSLGLGEAAVSLSNSFPLTSREMNADLSYGSLPLSKEMLVGGSLPLSLGQGVISAGRFIYFLFIKPTLSLSLFQF